jgi:lipopolysaccharide transport system permease protein
MIALLEFLVFAIFLIVFGVIPGLTVIYFPFILIIEFVLILGLSFGLSALNVYYRDVQYMWAVVLQAGFFAAPIIYPMSILPPKVASVIMLNPMTRIIIMFRDAVLYNTQLNIADVTYVSASALILLVIGYLIFRRLEPGLAEEM